MVMKPTKIRSMNKDYPYLDLFLRLRVTPITIWRNPTMRLPTTIERVESMFTSSFFPSTIEIT